MVVIHAAAAEGELRGAQKKILKSVFPSEVFVKKSSPLNTEEELVEIHARELTAEAKRCAPLPAHGVHEIVVFCAWC